MNENRSKEKSHLETHLQAFSPDVQRVVTEVLQLEKKKLYQKSPRYINEEVLSIIKDVVQ